MRVEKARRAAQPQRCRRCQRAVLVGDDDDRCALVAVVDAEAVSRLEEVIALLAGRASYDVVIHAGNSVIYHRDEWQVYSAKQKRPIHLEHRCEELER